MDLDSQETSSFKTIQKFGQRRLLYLVDDGWAGAIRRQEHGAELGKGLYFEQIAFSRKKVSKF